KDSGGNRDARKLQPPRPLPHSSGNQDACSLLRRGATTISLASPLRFVSISVCVTSLVACTELSPLRPNTTANPTNSVLTEGDFKVAFIEFGEQGSYQDPTQLENAIGLIQSTTKPLVITYLTSWK